MPKNRRRGSNSNSNHASSAGSSGSANTSTTASSADNEQTHNFGNDYNDHYLRTGQLPQAYIQNIDDPLVGYPKLQRLHVLKQAHNQQHAGKAYGRKVEPEKMSQELNQWTVKGSSSFDVVMVGGCLEDPPSYQSLINLPIPRITPRPSILFLWVHGSQLDMGRAVMEHWGFRRSEDIMYFTTSQDSVFFPKPQLDDCLRKTTWHCLMGLKGTLRRSDDTELINCNVDTDIIMEPQSQRANVVPEQIYNIIENFSLMNRRLHIIPAHTSFDKPVRARPGWVILSPDVFLDNFEPNKYAAESKTHGYRVPVDKEIDSLRPKTPTKMRSRK